MNENLPISSCHFWKYKLVLLQILYQSSVPPNITPLYIFSSNIIYFDQKEPIKLQTFENFKSSRQNLSNFSCQFWNDTSIPLLILHHSSLSWHINFKLIYSLLSIKESHQSPSFETSGCSGKNLPNCSCYFPNHKSVFLQILHHSLVSWKITPQALYTLVKSSLLKCKFLRLSSDRVKIRQIPYVNFESTSQFLFRFFIILQCQHITPLYIFSLCIFYFVQKDPMKISMVTLSSVLVKICQIPQVIFQTINRFFFFKFCLTLQCHER